MRSRRRQETEYPLPTRSPTAVAADQREAERPASASFDAVALEGCDHLPSALAKRPDRGGSARWPRTGTELTRWSPLGAGMARGQYKEGTLASARPPPFVYPPLPHCSPCSSPSFLAFLGRAVTLKKRLGSEALLEAAGCEKGLFYFVHLFFPFILPLPGVWKEQKTFQMGLLNPSGSTEQGLSRGGSTGPRARGWACVGVGRVCARACTWSAVHTCARALFLLQTESPLGTEVKALCVSRGS